MSELERRLAGALRDAIETSTRELNYRMPLLHQRLNRDGPVATVRHFLQDPESSDGFGNLLMRGRLDLSVEAVVLSDPSFATLFAEWELDVARARLGR